MSEPADKGLRGAIVARHTEVTLDQVCGYCAVRREEIVLLVEEGILTPTAGPAPNWRFAGDSLRRAAKALRLRQELEIELGAVAIVLDLLEEIESLRAQIPERPPHIDAAGEEEDDPRA